MSMSLLPKSIPIPVPDRLLLRAPNWLGDAVMALPAVRALKRTHPGTELSVAAPAALAPLWAACPFVDRVIPLAHPRRYRSTVPVLRRERFTMALLFPNSFRSAFEARRAGIGQLVAFDTPWRNLLVSHRVLRRPFDPRRLHQSYDYLHLVSALGAPHAPDLEEGEPVEGGLLRIAKTADLPASEIEPAPIVICPGAAYGPAKRWPAARFAEVGRALAERHAAPIVVMGAGGDAPAAAEVAAAIPGARDLAGKTDLAAFMATIARARLVVTNDSGAMHLAAAFGTPGVAIFGSTEPRLTGPIDPCVRVERFHVPCSPCFLRECPLDFACMERVTAAAVLASCEKALAEVAA